MLVFAIDPGCRESAWLIYEAHERKILAHGIQENQTVLEILREKLGDVDHVLIEQIQSYGMPVGVEIFTTVEWVGRFKLICELMAREAVDVPRKHVKRVLCGNTTAKDSNVMHALLEALGPKGTKKAPGPTYGMKSHLWAALGVAYAWSISQSWSVQDLHIVDHIDTNSQI